MNVTLSFASAETGLFIDRVDSGPPGWAGAEVPAGLIAIEGRHDHRCRRVDLATGEVVPWQPPAPPDDVLQTWAWDATAERWVSAPTLAAVARDVRAERARRMADADWVTLRAMRLGQPVPTDWAVYLQALADVPAQAGFPVNVSWPQPPA